jgi:hypothetical protein
MPHCGRERIWRQSGNASALGQVWPVENLFSHQVLPIIRVPARRSEGAAKKRMLLEALEGGSVQFFSANHKKKKAGLAPGLPELIRLRPVYGVWMV